MEPELQAAIDRLLRVRRGEGYSAVYHDLSQIADTPKADDEGVVANYFLDQHAAEPVEWPPHDGEWQMEVVFSGATYTRRVWFNAILPNAVSINDVRWSREKCAQWHARFLPIVRPTFPPREKPCEHQWGPWNHSDGSDGNPQSCRYCPKCEMHEFRTPDGKTETLRL